MFGCNNRGAFHSAKSGVVRVCATMDELVDLTEESPAAAFAVIPKEQDNNALTSTKKEVLVKQMKPNDKLQGLRHVQGL